MPRGYKLILPVATSKDLVHLTKTDHAPQQQLDATYFRIYEGLVPEHVLDFNLVFVIDRRGPPPVQESLFSKAGIIKITMEDKETIVKNRRVDWARLVELNGFCFDERYHDTPYLTEGDVFLQMKHTMELQTGDKDANAELMTTSHEDYIIPRTEIKDHIMRKPGTQHRYTLSGILRRIEIAGGEEAGRGQPRNIFGSFCRGGEFNYNIDQLLKCNSITELPPLSPEYFNANITYEGVSDELWRGVSLASKSKAQDFWKIYDEIKQKFEDQYFTTGEMVAVMGLMATMFSDDRDAGALVSTMLDAFKSVQGKMDTPTEDGISLSLNDVCIIFQIDNTIMFCKTLVRVPIDQRKEILIMYYPTG